MLSSDSVKKKFENLQSSQESVETLSLWCLHHRDHAPLIVSIWIQVFKAAEKESKRLSLFYVANDVCQKARKKKGQDFLTVFISALKEAILLSRFESIRKNIERILNIWEERNVFDNATIKEFRSLLEASKSSPVASFAVETQSTFSDNDNEQIMNDFNLDNLTTELERYQRNAESIEQLRVMLPSTSLAYDGNAKALLKSRQEGQRFVEDINQGHKKLSEFVDEYDKRLKRHHHLIIGLEKAQIFYETQLNEAGIVQTAYAKFGAAVKTVREKLSQMQKSGNYGQSPGMGVSPRQLENKATTATRRDADQFETVDMELDDDGKISTDFGDKPLSTAVSGQIGSLGSPTLGGMKLATNQSFLNNPPAMVTSNGAGFDIGASAPKRLKADPRQRNSQPQAPVSDISAPSFYSASQEVTPPISNPNWTQMQSPATTAYRIPFDPRSHAHTVTSTMQSPPVTFNQPHPQFQVGQDTSHYAIPPPPPPPAQINSTFGLDPTYAGHTITDNAGTVFEYDHGTPYNQQGSNFEQIFDRGTNFDQYHVDSQRRNSDQAFNRGNSFDHTNRGGNYDHQDNQFQQHERKALVSLRDVRPNFQHLEAPVRNKQPLLSHDSSSRGRGFRRGGRY